MKIKKHDGSKERMIITAMLTNDEVLGKIHRALRGDDSPFKSRETNQLAKWCLTHWSKYKTAPRERVLILFEKYQKRNPELAELMQDYLTDLNDEHVASGKDTNALFVIDEASEYFSQIKLEKLAKRINTALEIGDVESAEEARNGYEPAGLPDSGEFDIDDEEETKASFARKDTEQLVRFPGDLGIFLDRAFERDAFISFAGPEKRGKSYWLAEVVYRALRQRRKVLYYIVGDMSADQARQRLQCRIARRPLRAMPISLPESFVQDDEGVVGVNITEARQMPVLSAARATEAVKKFKKKLSLKKLPLKSHAVESSVMSAEDIEGEIGDLIKTGWIPDVVVIDYADILTPDAHAKHLEYRHQINETWKTLRRISQKFHLCLVTATQTAATSYDAPVIRKTDFSEDKRKAAHVTGMIGINQTSTEKRQGIFRLNWIFLRDGDWADTQVVHTAGNLGVGAPCIISRLFH